MNLLYVNNSSLNLSDFHSEIKESLLRSGQLPEELEELFVVSVSPEANPDGSTRFIINDHDHTGEIRETSVHALKRILFGTAP